MHTVWGSRIRVHIRCLSPFGGRVGQRSFALMIVDRDMSVVAKVGFSSVEATTRQACHLSTNSAGLTVSLSTGVT